MDMALVPREAFVSACRRLDRQALLGLVEDLFRARGYAVEPRDGTLCVTRDDTERRVVVDPAGSLAAVEADIVVVRRSARAAPERPRVLAPADLHQQLSYAVERDAAQELVCQYTDLDPDQAGDAESPSGQPVDARDGMEPAGRTEPAAAWRGRLGRRSAVAGLAVLGGALVVLVALSLAWSPPGTGGAAVDTLPTATATPTPDGLTDARTSAAMDEEYLALQAAESRADPGRPAGGNGSLPPGVSEDGVWGPDLLARAHVIALAEESYTLQLTHREFVATDLTGARVETVRVENGSLVEGAVFEVGDFRAGPTRLLDANGTATGASNATLGGVRRTVRGRLETLLSVDETAVVPLAEKGFRLGTDGNVALQARNATGTVYVDSRGLIRFGLWSYETTGEPAVEVVTSLQVRSVGPTQDGT